MGIFYHNSPISVHSARSFLRFSVLQSMASSYTAPPVGFRAHNALSMTTGLPSAMGRTWLTFPEDQIRACL